MGGEMQACPDADDAEMAATETYQGVTPLARG